MNDAQRHKLLSILKHDFNNVLTGVKTGLEIMGMDDYFDDPEHGADLKDVISASMRLAQQLDDLSLVFGDIPEALLPKQDVAVADVVEKLKKQCQLSNLSFELQDHGVTTLKADLSALTRSLFYAVSIVSEQKPNTIMLACQANPQGWEWTLPLSVEIFTQLQTALKNPEHEHLRTHARLSKLAISRLGGQWHLEALANGGQLRLSV